MAYIVKYVGNCFDDGFDISSLYNADLKRANRVVLVCGKEQAYLLKDVQIVSFDNIADVAECDSPLVLLTSENPFLTAVQVTHSLRAAECQVFIQYDGIYTADPSDEKYAHKLDRIDYDEVIELCNSGYNSVNVEMVEAAKKTGVILRVLSYNDPTGSGTIIKEVMAFGSATVKGIIKEPDICIVSLREIPDIPGISYHIFQAVSDAGINVDMISLPASDYGRQDISFTIHKEDKRTAQKILKEKQAELGYSDVIIKDNVAKISVVGSGVKTSKGVAARVFRILYENNISLRLISTSEIKINVFVDKSVADIAVRKIHQDFIG